MSIGLYDNDMVLYKQTPFNLELMKYASYYKNKREIVAMSPSFNPNQYSTFILRKDYYDENFPHNLVKYENIIYGGRAFSGDYYVPLDLIIERKKPDKSIYEKFKFNFGESNRLIAAYDVMMRACHLRLSLNGTSIWEDYEKQLDLSPKTRTLFFHDYDINKIKDSREAIEELLNRINTSAVSGYIAMKYPIITSTYEDMLYWCNFHSTGSFFNMEYLGPMEDEELFDLLKHQTLLTNPEKIDYNVTANFSDENDFLKRGLLKIYNQVLFLRMTKTKILLKYDKNFFLDKRWERILDLFNCFMASTLRLNREHFNRVINYDSLYSFVKSFDDVVRLDKVNRFNKEEARELFLLVKDTNYELFKSFYEAHKVQLKGGNFENDSAGN